MTESREVRIGDFFEESWGYDQTNADFYEVVKISASGKTIWLRHVGVRMTDDRKLVPIPGDYTATATDSRDGLLKRSLRRSPSYKEWSVRMTSYSYAYLWDGSPAYDTIASGAPGH